MRDPGGWCVVKVNGAAGLETFLHVAPEEADAVLELVVGSLNNNSSKTLLLTGSC
jgi:hypothetical protein